MSDLDQILNGEQPEVETAEPPAEPEAEQPEAQAEDVETEEAETTEPEAEPEKAEEPQTVPVAVVQELRRELRELKAQQQPEKPAPDFFEDPEGYRNYMQDAVKNATTSVKLEQSRFMAEKEFGKETVDAAFEYFNQHPEKSQALLQHPSPFHAAVEEFNRQRVSEDILKNPDEWVAEKEAELRKKIEAELVAKQAKDEASKLAPSMANTTGTGGGPTNNWTGPPALEEVIGE